jgi:hypothetical protein
MSVPAGLMEALRAQGGGGYAPDAGYAGLPPGQQGYAGTPPDAAPADSGGSSDDLLRKGIEYIQAALQAEPDDQDSAALAQIVKELYAIFSDRNKEQDGALAGKFSPRILRRGA